nr:hypothetical protein [uncultured Mucilaginibacter sp.]
MQTAKPSLTAFNNWLRFISCGVYLASLTQTGYCTEANCDSIGIGCLVGGIIGVLSGGAALTWLANPFIFTSWFTVYNNPKLSIFASIAAVLIALSFLLFNQIMKDEAGNYSKITAYGLGYWLWLLSAAIMVAGNLYAKSWNTVILNKNKFFSH